jgi:hypothetical protein
LGFWYHPYLPKCKVAHMEETSSMESHLL